MTSLNSPKIKQKYISWKDREHLFTPSNIARYERECYKDCIYKKRYAKHRIKPLPHSPCIWIMKDRVILNFTSDPQEDAVIERGPQLPEDRSEEPDQFHLDGE